MSEHLFDQVNKCLLCGGKRKDVQGNPCSMDAPRYERIFQAQMSELVMSHIDRMNDVCEIDTADRIVKDFTSKFQPLFDAYLEAKFPNRKPYPKQEQPTEDDEVILGTRQMEFIRIKLNPGNVKGLRKPTVTERMLRRAVDGAYYIQGVQTGQVYQNLYGIPDQEVRLLLGEWMIDHNFEIPEAKKFGNRTGALSLGYMTQDFRYGIPEEFKKPEAFERGEMRWTE